jgi:tetratricopeptide (TPR) repeat protein
MPRILLLAVLAALTACSSLRPPTSPAPVETRDIPGNAPQSTPAERPVVGPPLPPDFEPRGSAPPAPQALPTAALLSQIDTAMAAGEIDRAGALAERALRITPRDAQTWYTLANIQFQQRRYADAEGSAQRALSFAGDNTALVRRINVLLGTIKAAR